jgi:hypothetical protein
MTDLDSPGVLSNRKGSRRWVGAPAELIEPKVDGGGARAPSRVENTSNGLNCGAQIHRDTILFIPQGDRGIHGYGAPRGDQAGDQGYHRQQDRHGNEGRWIGGCYFV